jgi:eukaryotic-like serine/threonine-protein kinase
MSMSPGWIFQFGEFQLDVRAHSLRRGKAIVPLNSRAFDVLLYFVQNPGKVLTREELLKNVWAGSFVDENSLAQSISALRRALEEKPGDNNFIVTLPGRGYQFVSPVQVVASEDGNTVPESATTANSRSSGLLLQKQTIQTSVITTNEEKEQLSLPASRSRAGTSLVVVLALAAILVAGFYGWKQFRRAPSPGQATSSTVVSAAPRRSVAVLGFRNLSGRPEEGWLSTALAEMLSTEMEAGEKLRLVSGEDIARTKRDLPLGDADSLSRNTLAQLHKNLDSDFIVLGSYTALGEKPGTRIRLDVRLQDTVAGETIADVAVVGGEADLFDLASQAGSRLREKLGVEAISPVETVSVRASSPSNRDAARLYAEGLARLRVLEAPEARDLLQQAVAADPKFSLAHSALAEAWRGLGYAKKAQQEARQAYDLSANLSREERLVVEGRYRDLDHEHEKAIEIYRALFTLFPDNLDYGLRLARNQTRGGKAHDALSTVDALRKLAPPASEDPRIEFVEVEGWILLGDSERQEQPLARAVEKAKAQGSRVILAQARQMQCELFNRLGQLQDAVSACREARDIFAAAGNREGEARSLQIWAVVISRTDAPESIPLFLQAQTIFRRNGSEAGEADVLDNLGNIYEGQGDLATAEKMIREAVAIFRRLDDQRNMTAAIGNLADNRVDQGDLRGAIQLYEEARQGRGTADTGYGALAGLNIALVRQLQGDLVGARQGFEQSLAIWQKNGDQYLSAYAVWGLGSLLLQGADFAGARKMYEQVLVIRTAAGDKILMAETQLGLADLSLEEARSPVEQEAAARQALEVFQKQKIRDDETNAWCILARALLAQGKVAEAKDAVQHARSQVAKSQNPEIRWRTAITAARIETAEKSEAHSAAGSATRNELAAIIAKARALGYMGIELDARLVLAEIEMKSGQIAAGRAHLDTIEADAKAKGYNLVARKAAIARG